MRGSQCERERARLLVASTSPVHIYRVYIAVRSDDRNDSNHRLTSGIRHSDFRVATPAAIVAVYDCRARSPSLSHTESVLLFLAPPLLSLSLSHSHRPVLALTQVNPASSSLHLASLLVLSLSLAIFRSISFSLSHPFFSYLSLPFSSRISFLFPLSRSLPSSLHSLTHSFLHIRSRSLPTSRWFALDPTRYRPHSRAQTTRQRYMYMHSHRSPPLLQLRRAESSIALLRGPEKS